MSTLHTNDAPSSIARLVDMGVEPFLLAASTRMIAAQRLLRTLCEHCKTSVAQEREARKRLGIQERPDDQFHRANGCKCCGQTGYHGRSAIIEVMRVTEPLRELIARNADTDVIRKWAVTHGKMIPLWDKALARARAGATSVEEVIRVLGLEAFQSTVDSPGD